MHLLIGLAVAFVVIALTTRMRGPRRHCRWRADRTGSRDGQFRFVCAACGAEVFTDTSRLPTTCKAP